MNQFSRRSPAQRIEMIMQGAAGSPSALDAIAHLRKVQAEIRAFLEAQGALAPDMPAPASLTSENGAPPEAPLPMTADVPPRLAADVREAGAQEPQDSSIDAAWMVMEAAHDFGDQPTIDACRRVIDASLNGAQADPSDLTVVNDYFK